MRARQQQRLLTPSSGSQPLSPRRVWMQPLSPRIAAPSNEGIVMVRGRTAGAWAGSSRPSTPRAQTAAQLSARSRRHGSNGDGGRLSGDKMRPRLAIHGRPTQPAMRAVPSDRHPDILMLQTKTEYEYQWSDGSTTRLSSPSRNHRPTTGSTGVNVRWSPVTVPVGEARSPPPPPSTPEGARRPPSRGILRPPASPPKSGPAGPTDTSLVLLASGSVVAEIRATPNGSALPSRPQTANDDPFANLARKLPSPRVEIVG